MLLLSNKNETSAENVRKLAMIDSLYPPDTTKSRIEASFLLERSEVSNSTAIKGFEKVIEYYEVHGRVNDY